MPFTVTFYAWHYGRPSTLPEFSTYGYIRGRIDGYITGYTYLAGDTYLRDPNRHHPRFIEGYTDGYTSGHAARSAAGDISVPYEIGYVDGWIAGYTVNDIHNLYTVLGGTICQIVASRNPIRP